MNKPQISASTGNITITGSTQVTFTAKNATSATYRVDNGTETAFTDSVSLTLGENLAVGAKTTVTITAKNADGTTSQTFTYTMGEDKPVLSISPDTEETFTDTLDVTVTADNVTAATYTIGNNAAVAFSGTKTFTIGDSMEEGESITITVTGTGNKGNQETITATFTKEEQNTGSCVYFKNTDNWQQIFCYAWNSETYKMTAWPGTAMKVYDETNQIYPELFIAVR